jgi:hypothetical protein
MTAQGEIALPGAREGAPDKLAPGSAGGKDLETKTRPRRRAPQDVPDAHSPANRVTTANHAEFRAQTTSVREANGANANAHYRKPALPPFGKMGLAQKFSYLP